MGESKLLNVAECNKLIAEFMGYGRNWVNGHGQFSNRNYQVPKGKFVCTDENWGEYRKESHFEIKELIFHSNWEWLMPVITHIESIGYELILGRNRAYWNDIDGTHTGYQYEADSKLNAAYLAVVQFIQVLRYKDNKPEQV